MKSIVSIFISALAMGLAHAQMVPLKPTPIQAVAPKPAASAPAVKPLEQPKAVAEVKKVAPAPVKPVVAKPSPVASAPSSKSGASTKPVAKPAAAPVEKKWAEICPNEKFSLVRDLCQALECKRKSELHDHPTCVHVRELEQRNAEGGFRK